MLEGMLAYQGPRGVRSTSAVNNRSASLKNNPMCPGVWPGRWTTRTSWSAKGTSSPSFSSAPKFFKKFFPLVKTGALAGDVIGACPIPQTAQGTEKIIDVGGDVGVPRSQGS